MSPRLMIVAACLAFLTSCVPYQDDYFYPMSACCRRPVLPTCATPSPCNKTAFRYACPSCPTCRPCDNYYPCLDTYCHIGP